MILLVFICSVAVMFFQTDRTILHNTESNCWSSQRNRWQQYSFIFWPHFAITMYLFWCAVIHFPSIFRSALDPSYGNFITVAINFVIVAFVLFLVIRGMNRVIKQEEAAPAAPPPTREELLLTEIRDLLKTR